MHNTGNPLGSKDILDLYDNSENIDYFANSQLDEHPDRFGTKRLTLAGLIKRSMALRNEINDFSGALMFKPEWSDVPKNVSEGVGGEGGALNLQAEALGNRSEINKITSREALRRTYQEVGLNLVEGSFELGAVLQSVKDVLLEERTGKVYSWSGSFPKVVDKNTSPYLLDGDLGDWKNISDYLLLTALSGEDGVKLVGGAATKEEVDLERKRIDILDFSKFEQYERVSKYANILMDGVYNNTPVPFDIMLFGDSTMWGSIPFLTTSQDPKNPGVSLKQTLDLIYPNNITTVTNSAIPGSTLRKLLAGLDGGYGTYEQRLKAAGNTKIVYCNHCLNDCGSYQSTLEQYREDLVMWVNITRSHNKIPVLVTPSLISPIKDGREDQMKRQPGFIQAMIDVAKTMSVDLVDNFKYTCESAALYLPQDIAPDGVHLSQLFHQQAGRNMAIPLIRPHVITDVGDVAGLSTSVWNDNISQSRGIWDKVPTRFSSILSGDAKTETQLINFPIVLTKPTKNTVLSIGCALTTNGGRGQLTYFGHEGQPQFSGIVDYKAIGGDDFDCLTQPLYCGLPAGLSIVGVKINTAISPTPNVNFTFSGVQLIKRTDNGFGFSNNSGFQLAREVLVRDELSTVQYMYPGVVLFELRSSFSPFETVVKLHWNLTTNKVELVTTSGTYIVWDTPLNGPQAGIINLNDDRTVTAKLGAMSVTSQPSSGSLGRMFVANSGPYWVKKY